MRDTKLSKTDTRAALGEPPAVNRREVKSKNSVLCLTANPGSVTLWKTLYKLLNFLELIFLIINWG